MPKKSYKIGIIGAGMVGGAIRNYFESVDAELYVYDKYKHIGSLSDINKADIAFICVPTPYCSENGCDLSYVKDAISILKGSKIIVIKSTILPGSTEMLQRYYPQHKILFNPEFLSEVTAVDEFRNPDVQLIGYTNESKDMAQVVLDILPKAPFSKIMGATEAEMAKYFHNTHGVMRIAFANQIYDLCDALNVNYESVMESAARSIDAVWKNFGKEHYLKVWHKGFRGYGGTCFPKDVKALIWLGDKVGVDMKVHKASEAVNAVLMKSQNIEDPEQMGKILPKTQEHEIKLD